MRVMGDELIWCGVPICIISVLEVFSCMKLVLIHTFVSSRQVVSVDRDGADGVADLVGLIFIYSCVSSA